jgi:hypothetical protein
MEKRQILWAIVFGSMLAITGCGDSEDGDGGNPGSGGSAGSSGTAGSGGSGGGGFGDFCTSLCAACGGGQADCEQACDIGFGSIPPAFLDTCPSELDTLTTCFAANDCDGDDCDAELTAWTTCVTMNISN